MSLISVDTNESQILRDKEIIKGKEEFIKDKENEKIFFVYDIVNSTRSDGTIVFDGQYNNMLIVVKRHLHHKLASKEIE